MASRRKSKIDLKWFDDYEFSWMGHRFWATLGNGTHDGSPKSPGTLSVWKTREMIDMHAKLLGAVRPKRILELGVFTGGSLAMSGLAPTLDKVVGIELETRPLKSLEDFISANHLSETIQPYLGVDQADRHTLDRIMETEFSGQPLDLVIDDASHLLEPTRLSFEALFPRLRSGGVYIIEDWAAGHLADFTANAASDTAMKRAVRLDSVKPLSILAFELTLATARNPQLFPRLEINRHWIRITKGDSKTSFHLDDFRLAEHYVDPFGLVPRLATS